MESSKNDLPIDYDGLWKSVVSNSFEDFVKFFLPQLYPLVDFSKGITFLEQEFQEISTTEGKKGKTYNDKLASLFLLDGSEHKIFIHIELQSSRDPNLPKRMFVYFYRIRDKYDNDVTALALYTHDDIPQKHDRYLYEYQGTKLSYEFNTRIVKNYVKSELLKSSNPFAFVVLAAQYLNETMSNDQKRLFFKKKLVSLLEERGFSPLEMAQLLIFIKLMLKLPEEKELEFESFIQKTPVMEVYPQLQRLTNQLFQKAYGESVEDLITAKKAAVKHQKAAEAKTKAVEIAVKHQKAAEAKTKAAETAKIAAETAKKAAETAKKAAEAKVINQNIQTTRKLLERGMPIEDIADINNMAIAEIEAIKAKFKL